MPSSTVALVLKSVAGCSQAAMVCSPSIVTYRIFKQKDVGVASVIPLVTLLANCHVWAVYGYLIKNWFPVFSVFIFGEFMTLVYLSVYWRYTTQRRYVNRVLVVTSIVLVVVTIYAMIGAMGYTGQTAKSVSSVVGILADLAGACMYAAPMEKLLQVFKYKSAAFIIAPMVAAGLVNNILWVTYGILTSNWFIISPSGTFMVLNSFTLVLCIVLNPTTHPLPVDFHIYGHKTLPLESASNADFDKATPSSAFTAVLSPLQSIQVSRQTASYVSDAVY